MGQFVARANVEHFDDLLHNDKASVKDRLVLNKLLIAEERKLARDTAHLEIRTRCDRLALWRGGFADGSVERAHAERVVAEFAISR
jgi:hypothetical protein